ncbi:MAG: iron-sulfur cluster insertion protein ErpA [Alphaproteobacteria bacterium]|nr:iron-sulfur cluster insertion protein ErpA [Alphaproteobacteria bacterium]
MLDTPAHAAERKIEIADSAAKRIADLVRSENNDTLMLRVSVSGGGCSGFQYAFSLDDKNGGEDVIFEANGVRVVIDDISLDLVSGARLDFVDEMMGSFFKLENPNAASTCGCGSSFSI